VSGVIGGVEEVDSLDPMPVLAPIASVTGPLRLSLILPDGLYPLSGQVGGLERLDASVASVATNLAMG
jgi:hypothetical protein